MCVCCVYGFCVNQFNRLWVLQSVFIVLTWAKGSKRIDACVNPAVNKWNQYNSIDMREENYVNVLANQEKFKLLEWMKNNKLHPRSETHPNPDLFSISHFVWDPKSKTWHPKYEE
ncbi:hypothetical protein IGI04_018305 [Brassica rapa subsp. trilocularis]|uniref:Uncharacterized protein n=2 Tax=Brassica campestris TaxID=3711 RepID=M4DAS9_BRACM|nr:hypothetical protein IGI04_018305 [Brassica rapa subsp. trilocularis]